MVMAVAPMDILSAVPAEVGVQVLSQPCLSLTDLAQVAQVSRRWNALVQAQGIWRTLGLRLGFVPPHLAHSKLDAVVQPDDRALGNELAHDPATNWHTWVIFQLSLSRQWGRALSLCSPSNSASFSPSAGPHPSSKSNPASSSTSKQTTQTSFPFPLVRSTLPTRGADAGTVPSGADSGFVIVPDKQLAVLHNATRGLWTLDLGSHARLWSAPRVKAQLILRVAEDRGVVAVLASRLPKTRERELVVSIYSTGNGAGELPRGHLAHIADVPIPQPPTSPVPDDTGPKIRLHYPIVAVSRGMHIAFISVKSHEVVRNLTLPDQGWVVSLEFDHALVLAIVQTFSAVRELRVVRINSPCNAPAKPVPVRFPPLPLWRADFTAVTRPTTTSPPATSTFATKPSSSSSEEADKSQGGKPNRDGSVPAREATLFHERSDFQPARYWYWSTLELDIESQMLCMVGRFNKKDTVLKVVLIHDYHKALLPASFDSESTAPSLSKEKDTVTCMGPGGNRSEELITPGYPANVQPIWPRVSPPLATGPSSDLFGGLPMLRSPMHYPPSYSPCASASNTPSQPQKEPDWLKPPLSTPNGSGPGSSFAIRLQGVEAHYRARDKHRPLLSLCPWGVLWLGHGPVLLSFTHSAEHSCTPPARAVLLGLPPPPSHAPPTQLEPWQPSGLVSSLNILDPSSEEGLPKATKEASPAEAEGRGTTAQAASQLARWSRIQAERENQLYDQGFLLPDAAYLTRTGAYAMLTASKAPTRGVLHSFPPLTTLPPLTTSKPKPTYLTPWALTPSGSTALTPSRSSTNASADQSEEEPPRQINDGTATPGRKGGASILFAWELGMSAWAALRPEEVAEALALRRTYGFSCA